MVQVARDCAYWRMLSPEEMRYKTWSAGVCMMVWNEWFVIHQFMRAGKWWRSRENEGCDRKKYSAENRHQWFCRIRSQIGSAKID